MAASPPLVVAVIAMVLLFGSVTFEVAFQRVYYVDVENGAGWQQVGHAGPAGAAGPAPPDRGLAVAASGNVSLRLRVDNGYPWSYAQHYEATYGGLSIASGDVTARARDTGVATFEVPASTFFQGAAAAPKIAPNTTFVDLEVRVGDVTVPASFQLQEASP
jgi:hypothetical protein